MGPAETESGQAARVADALAFLPFRQIEIARHLSFSESHLSAVKKGREQLSRNLAAAFEREYGIRAGWLLDGLGPMTTPGGGRTWSDTGPTTTTEAPWAEVEKETIYRCGVCKAPVRPHEETCPGCYRELLWPKDR